MLSVLKKYNFGKKFIHIIKTLYNELTADVMVNGIRYGILKILKGVKQGDSLSCLLFILCMEVLLKNIHTNENIKGVKVGELDIKSIIYADDTSPIVSDKNSIQK